MEYKGFTIEKEYIYPKGHRWMYYKTSEGVNHDYDTSDDGQVYCGNCKWASTIQDAVAEIDELLTEA
jgi:hypothetical protein